MDNNITALERAFELAQSGQYGSVTDIKRKLHSEGYSMDQVTGPALNKQLRQIIREAGKPDQ